MLYLFQVSKHFYDDSIFLQLLFQLCMLSHSHVDILLHLNAHPHTKQVKTRALLC